jgi:hypothetical protein
VSTIAGTDALRPYVMGLVQDSSGKLQPADYDRAIDQAVLRFSRRRPRRVVVDVAATGARRYPMPAPWVTDTSSLLVLEHVVAGEETELEARAYQVRLGPDGEELRLVDAPAAGTTLRLTIAVAHQMDATTSTIPAAHQDTVAQLAGGFACLALANIYSGRGEASVRADQVSHGSKGTEYAKRATELFRAAGEEISADAPAATSSARGPGAGSARAAAAEVSFAGEMGFLTHGG